MNIGKKMVKIQLATLPKKKLTNSIIQIESIDGKKYTVIIDTKKDRLGLSYHAKKLKVKFYSFTHISAMITGIRDQEAEHIKSINETKK